MRNIYYKRVTQYERAGTATARGGGRGQLLKNERYLRNVFRKEYYRKQGYDTVVSNWWSVVSMFFFYF